MDFSEMPPSTQWAALKYRGQKFAEVWFKPEGQPFAITFRIPRASFQLPGIDKQLTVGNLLKAVGRAPEEVASWRHVPEALATDKPEVSATDEFTAALPAPQDASHLEVHVQLKPPPGAGAGAESSAAEVPAAQWEELESRWKAILGVEASIETLRLSMESLMAEMESALKKTLTVEEKVHALRADLSQWTKEKKRVQDALPKMKDAIHRSVWALGTPERKQLATLYDEHIQPKVPFPRMAEVLKELEALQKARQVLYSLSQSVYQDSRTISASVQTALRTLQNNAAINAKKKRDASKGGKFFKDIRRSTGL